MDARDVKTTPVHQYTDRPALKPREADIKLTSLCLLVCAFLVIIIVSVYQQRTITDLQAISRKLDDDVKDLYLMLGKYTDTEGTGTHNTISFPHDGGHADDDDDLPYDGRDRVASRRRRGVGNSTRSRHCERKRYQRCTKIQSLHMYADTSVVLSSTRDENIERLIDYDVIKVESGTYFRNSGFRPSPGPIKVWTDLRWPTSRYELFADLNRLHTNGTVKITKSGLYLIYAQVTFQTAALHQSVVLYKTERGHKAAVSSCLVSERYMASPSYMGSVYILCPITTTHYLQRNTLVHLESTYEWGKIMLHRHLTYWGLVHLS